MPHLTIEYSANVEEWTSIGTLCDRLRVAAIATGVFPMAGIRVRAIRCDHHSIADGTTDCGFVDISVRIRAGRPPEARKSATEILFAAARDCLEDVLAQRPLALSLEMRNIDPEFSPKTESIRRFVTSGE